MSSASRSSSSLVLGSMRASVCLSVLRGRAGSLDEGVHWPLCMRMFLPLDELQPLCEAAGFEHVAIDTSDSLMSFELDAPEAPPAATTARNRVHVGSSEFEHLGRYDVNELCARVVVTGVKPTAVPS